ncbi:hypothetical protein IJV79_00595, partial [bacterium]|nr:hypothetical protein [bacterium]
MTQLNKLQLKAEVMTVLSRLQMDVETPYLDDYLAVLNEQEDKSGIAEILVREMYSANEAKAILVCIIFVKLFPQTELEDILWEILKNKAVSDEAKTVVLNLLKDFGKMVDLEKIKEHFDNPQNLIDSETENLLQAAIINPEAQIDFIDFLNSLSYEDKNTLVSSLAEDYSCDELANLLNPIVLYSPESEIGRDCIEILGETKSQLALYTLEELLTFVKDDEVKNLVKKNISKLKISGIREENAIEF